MPAVIIGGVAASLIGRPRMTKDVDFLAWLDERRWGELAAAAPQYGFAFRTSDPLAFAAESRVLLLVHQPSGIEVDVTFGALPLEAAIIERAIAVEIRGLSLPIAKPEDLVIMKLVAHRPRDLADVESVLDAQPALDVAAIRRTLQEFAELSDFDIVGEWDRLYAHSKSRN